MKVAGMRRATASAFRVAPIASIIVMLAASCAPPAMAASDTGWTSVEKLVNAVSSWKGDKADPGVNKQVAQYIDYQSMGQRALGSEQWNKLTTGQRQQFVTALRNLMEQRYYPRWHRIFAKAKLDHVSDAAAGFDTLVKTNMVVGKKTDSLVWRLTGKGNEAKIVSLAIGDNDLLTKLKVRLQEKLAKSNFPTLLAWMQAKSKQVSTATAEVSSTEAVIGESK